MLKDVRFAVVKAIEDSAFTVQRMAELSKEAQRVDYNDDSIAQDDPVLQNEKTSDVNRYKKEIVWQNVIKFVLLHMFALIGLVKIPQMLPWTVGFTFACSILSKLVISQGKLLLHSF